MLNAVMFVLFLLLIGQHLLSGAVKEWLSKVGLSK